MSSDNGVNVDYDHQRNRHTSSAPRAVLPLLFEADPPSSLLDVGCGLGTWAAVALELGISDVMGIDGVDIDSSELLIPRSRFRVVDLRESWDLKRKFDVALCLEVGEHLDETCSQVLVKCLTAHADEVVFSAACPGQPGQHHVNCQWPEYWQRIFNGQGFVCSDSIRWRIWTDDAVEVWYRQNLFMANRDPVRAGHEERIKPVMQPALAAGITSYAVAEELETLKEGTLPWRWYLETSAKAVVAKIRKKLAPRSR
jgi:SAM-dependent methyltransferase